MVKLTASDRQKLVDLGRAGEHTLEELGTMFGVTRERARQVLVEAGVTVRRGQAGRHTILAKRFPPETCTEVRAYAAKHGVSAAKVHYHTSYQVLHNWVGIPTVDIRRKVSDDELHSLHAAGLSAAAIARQLGMAVNGINDRLRRMGLNGAKGGSPGVGGSPLHRGLGDEVRRLRGEGLSYNQIASELDCSVGNIQYHLGRKRRPRATA